MTIAIGIMASDGIVIGADSEESTGFLKSSQQKLMPFVLGMQLGSSPSPPAGVCVFTGAGSGGYIDAVTEELMEVLHDDTLNGVALQKAFGKRLKEFYEDHVIPFAGFPENDRPAMELLIGIQKRHLSGLYVTDRTTIRSARPFGVVGIGGTFAKIMLDALWKSAPAKEMSALAVYVLMSVKEHIEGCGKFSSIMTLHNSVIQDNPAGGGSMLVAAAQAATYMSGQQIFDLEMLFASEFAKREKEALWEFISAHC